jgi:cardiolipin synthase
MNSKRRFCLANEFCKSLLTWPNFLSFLRIPLGILFLIGSGRMRLLCIALAGITDFLDGFLARYSQQVTRLGTLLDPIGDKFFVVLAIGTLWQENSLESWEALSFFSRDFALVAFSGYLFMNRKWGDYIIRSFRCGKASTVLQLILLFLLSAGWKMPLAAYYALLALGAASFFELLSTSTQLKAR